jgi:hypothetical protein
MSHKEVYFEKGSGESLKDFKQDHDVVRSVFVVLEFELREPMHLLGRHSTT